MQHIPFNSRMVDIVNKFSEFDFYVSGFTPKADFCSQVDKFFDEFRHYGDELYEHQKHDPRDYGNLTEMFRRIRDSNGFSLEMKLSPKQKAEFELKKASTTKELKLNELCDHIDFLKMEFQLKNHQLYIDIEIMKLMTCIEAVLRPCIVKQIEIILTYKYSRSQLCEWTPFVNHMKMVSSFGRLLQAVVTSWKERNIEKC